MLSPHLRYFRHCDLVAFIHSLLPFIVGTLSLALVAGDIVMKLGLYIVCRRFSKTSHTAAALTQDHRNDLVLNSVALVTSAIGTIYVIYSKSIVFFFPTFL